MLSTMKIMLTLNIEKVLLENTAMIFASQSQSGKDSFEEVDKLRAKIGQLTMENDF